MRKSFRIATCAAAIAFPAALNAQDVLERTGNAARNAAESTLHAVDHAVDKVGQAGRNLGQGVGQTIDNVNDRAITPTGNHSNHAVDANRRDMRQIERQADRWDQTQWQNPNTHQNATYPISDANFQNDAQYQSQGAYGQDVHSFQSNQHGWNQPVATHGPVYVLRYDQWGREFICVNGFPIYFDNQTNRQDQQSADSMRYRAGYGSYDNQTSQTNSNQSGADEQGQRQDNLNADESTPSQSGSAANTDTDAQVDVDVNNQNALGTQEPLTDGNTGDSPAPAETESSTDTGNDTDAVEQPSQQPDVEIDAQTDTDANLNLDSDATQDSNVDADTSSESEL